MVMKKFCASGCIHYVTKQIPGTLHHDGVFIYRDPARTLHTCELYPERYSNWMEEFGQVPIKMLTDKDYEIFNQCYVPNKITASLDKCINLAQEILDKIDKE